MDTATLAVHLQCTPGYVRFLVRVDIIKPLPQTVRRHRFGRPSQTFDLDAVDDDIRHAVDLGRVVLDQGRIRVR